MMQSDEIFMRRALELARMSEGRTAPNPPVGAVVVKDGRIIAEGRHRKAGGPHAEVEALHAAGEAAAGATIYVTLEPCSTHGRTPPCTELIKARGIDRVVVAVRDPNPAHRGRGLRILRRAGIEVDCGILRKEATELLAPFACLITTGLPLVTLKMGMTLDGRIADRKDKSRWITGAAARREVQQLRRRCDAIMVGTRTALLDNPSLTVSGGRQPRRVIVDSRGTLPLSAKIFTDGNADNTLIAVSAAVGAEAVNRYRAAGATVFVCGRGRRVSLKILLRILGDLGVMHLLCEGGGELAAALIEQDLVDRYEFFVAPSFLGGTATAVVGGKGWLLDNAPAIEFYETGMVGKDVRIRGRRCS